MAREEGRCRVATVPRLGTARIRAPPLPMETMAVPDLTPSAGAAVVIRGAFDTSLTNLWIEGVWQAVACTQKANTVTILDTIVLSIYGPSAVSISGGASGSRIDIVQMSRITMNQQALPNENTSTVWIDIGAGVNTVRLDNVGLINGGVGVQMHSPADEPGGVDPGRPLFVFGNDLEIDFPQGNAIELLRGESLLLSNSYIQGSKTANGIYVGPEWNSEVQVTNSRIFGNALAGVELAGGVRALFSNNIIGDNSANATAAASGIVVRKGVSSFSLTGNHVGPVFSGESAANHKYGIEIENGVSDAYTVTGNVLIGNQIAGIIDGGTGERKAVANNAGAGPMSAGEFAI